jgi:hypothetical protein
MMQRLLVISGFALLAATALAQDVKVDYDKTANFAKFKTYKWVTLDSKVRPNQLVEQRITRSVDAELAKKGLTKTDSDSADLYIGYQASIDEQQSMTTFGTGCGPGWGYGGGWGGWGGGMSTTTIDKIPMGTVVLSMFDPKQKQLVFRSTGANIEIKKDPPDKADKRAAKIIAKMFKKYPPPPAKG